MGNKNRRGMRSTPSVLTLRIKARRDNKSTTSRLLALPRELRNLIYELILLAIPDLVIEHTKVYYKHLPIFSGILLANKQLNREFQDVLCDVIPFAISLSGEQYCRATKRRRTQQFLRSKRKIRERHVAAARNLSIDLDFFTSYIHEKKFHRRPDLMEEAFTNSLMMLKICSRARYLGMCFTMWPLPPGCIEMEGASLFERIVEAIESLPEVLEYTIECHFPRNEEHPPKLEKAMYETRFASRREVGVLWDSGEGIIRHTILKHGVTVPREWAELWRTLRWASSQ